MADVITASTAMRVIEILCEARERGASDVHLAPGEPAIFRIDGQLSRRPERTVTKEELTSFVAAAMDEAASRALHHDGACDVVIRSATTDPIRIHAFRALDGVRCAVRLLPASVPLLDDLDVPRVVADLARRTNGLLLIVGPSGSGKTTLLAAIVGHLNSTCSRHVITLEDPIEYLHVSETCAIAQCEVGRDCRNLSAAIQGVLRADPDVIVIGELRDSGALRHALAAAETGHLVIATLHTIDAPQALERIVDAFPTDARDQIRVQVAQTLVGVIALRLVRLAKPRGRRAAVEILVATDAVRNLVREGKFHQLRSVMQVGRTASMQTLEMHLSELAERGQITTETALQSAQRPAELTVLRDVVS